MIDRKLFARGYTPKPRPPRVPKAEAIERAREIIAERLPKDSGESAYRGDIIRQIQDDPVSCHLNSQDCHAILNQIEAAWWPGGLPNEFEDA
jgi:hypothetical protein